MYMFLLLSMNIMLDLIVFTFSSCEGVVGSENA